MISPFLKSRPANTPSPCTEERETYSSPGRISNSSALSSVSLRGTPTVLRVATCTCVVGDAQHWGNAVCLWFRERRRRPVRPLLHRPPPEPRAGGRRAGCPSRSTDAGAGRVARLDLLGPTHRRRPAHLAGRPAGAVRRAAGVLRPHPPPPRVQGVGTEQAHLRRGPVSPARRMGGHPPERPRRHPRRGGHVER